jgi:DMSO reductase family type II enzyme heme b subunit
MKRGYLVSGIWNSAILALLFLCASVQLAEAQDLGTDAQRSAGKQVYDQKCSQCHGMTGAADGEGADFFRPAPRDFTSGVFKFRTSASGELPTDADLVRSIREGMPYTGMPAWPGLSNEEVQNLVYHIKTFNGDFDGVYGNPQPVGSSDPVSMSEESIARGRAVFEENQCIDCHGNLGRGDGKSARTLEDNWSTHIRPADLTKRWTFRGGATREDIYRTFTTGLDGSPMPSYSIDPPEDQWHLVNYVYSLSQDEPIYATVVVASPYDGEIDFSNREGLFDGATPAYFPIVGQVIDPGRAFYPGVNGVSVRAVYNEADIAIELSWNDMSAETRGDNSPTMAVGDTIETAVDTMVSYSDAIGVQFPSQPPDGQARPYFLFGDSKRTVDLWFVELAGMEAQNLEGSGGERVNRVDSDLEVSSFYDKGEWVVAFKRSRALEGRTVFDEQTFVPIAFSVWDGFNRERGAKRGVSSWYHLYLAPLQVESPAGPMAMYGFGTLLLGLGIVALVRRKYGKSA